MTCKDIMDLVYERIKHGDESHQKWLRDECIKIQLELEDANRLTRAARHPDSHRVAHDSEGNYYDPDTSQDEVN